MRILSCCPRGYCGAPETVSYEYLSFVEVPRSMGHQTDHFDHRLMAARDRADMNRRFLAAVRGGSYDLVMIVTHEDEFVPEVLDESRDHSIVMAWNCDDDWRWEGYSLKWIEHYSYMVTTCRWVYEANREHRPNLLLSQWACTGLDDGLAVPKDIDINFVGQCYGERASQVELLRRQLGLVAYGRGVSTWRSRWKARLAWRLLGIRDKGGDFLLAGQRDVKAVWNRSRLSFAPLEASAGEGLQIKARVFDMGLSGSVMLCPRNPSLYEFYEPGSEFVEYATMDECVAKARHLLEHEDERAAITARYRRRTEAEHLWKHRFEVLWKAMGLPTRRPPAGAGEP
jgi:hypothetical protein